MDDYTKPLPKIVSDDYTTKAVITPIPRDSTCKYCDGSRNLWTFLDAVFVINMQDREDRYQESAKRMHESGLCQVKIAAHYRPVRSPFGFDEGCWTSHRCVAREALKLAQHDKVLVLEDDFFFDSNRTMEDIIAQVEKALNSLPAKWNRLLLGNISMFKIPYCPGVDRAMALLLHAQLWSEKGLQFMANFKDWKITGIVEIDGALALGLTHSYNVTPNVAFQSCATSDRNNQQWIISEQGISTMNWALYAIWFVGALIVIGFVAFLLRNRFGFWKTTIWFSTMLSLPFLIVWILVLTDVI